MNISRPTNGSMDRREIIGKNQYPGPILKTRAIAMNGMLKTRRVAYAGSIAMRSASLIGAQSRAVIINTMFDSSPAIVNGQNHQVDRTGRLCTRFVSVIFRGHRPLTNLMKVACAPCCVNHRLVESLKDRATRDELSEAARM